MKVPFNKPVYLPFHEEHTERAIKSGKLSSGGPLAGECESQLKVLTGSDHLLVPSATAALEMMALLLDIRPGDEVIAPSYTFVTSVSAFCLRGATIKFADIDEYGNILPSEIERLISKKTKAVCVVHYAGNSCNMEEVKQICQSRNIPLLEDAAQCIGSLYKGQPLGTLGKMGCYSFHDTKNITGGEGGSLIVNDSTFLNRAEIIRDKGTNRKSFLKGEVDKYTWLELGSSFCLSELNASYLLPQLKHLQAINDKRKVIWQSYSEELTSHIHGKNARILENPEYNTPNFHMFAIIFSDQNQRDRVHSALNNAGVQATFHYQPLHLSPYGLRFDKTSLPATESFASQILRLPLWYNLEESDREFVIENVKNALA